jgi:hypothetical protein
LAFHSLVKCNHSQLNTSHAKHIFYNRSFPQNPPALPPFDGRLDLFEASFLRFDPDFPRIEAIFPRNDAREDQKDPALALFDAKRYLLSGRL